MYHMGKPVSSQSFGDKSYSRTVYRCINDFQIVLTGDGLGIERQGFDTSNIFFVDFFSDHLDQSRISIEIDIGNRTYFIDLGNRIFIVGGNHLCPIVPICFISVIFFGIMRSSKNNTALTTQFPNGVRHFGCRP